MFDNSTATENAKELYDFSSKFYDPYDMDERHCYTCKYWRSRPENNPCPCFDYRYVTFYVPYFSSDICYGMHSICSLYEPSPNFKVSYETWKGFLDYYSRMKNLCEKDLLSGYTSFMPREPIMGTKDVHNTIFQISSQRFLLGDVVHDGKMIVDRLQKIRKTKESYKWDVFENVELTFHHADESSKEE